MKSAPVVESISTSPNLDGVTIAPTVAEIVADHDRMERCAAAIMHVFADAPPPIVEDREEFEVQEVSEADVLRDLVSFAVESDTHDLPEDREFVAQLPRTTFIDTETMTQGAQAIVRHWTELLDTLPCLNVIVAEGKSSIFVFDQIMSII